MTTPRLPSAKRSGRLSRSTAATKSVRVTDARRRKRQRENATTTIRDALPKRFASLFPGCRLADIRLPEHDDLVMLHVLSAGGAQHRAWLLARHGDVRYRRWIIRMRDKGLTVTQILPMDWQSASPYARLGQIGSARGTKTSLVEELPRVR